MNGTYWTQPETDKLLELAGDLPWPILCKRYNAWAKATGYTARNSNALTIHLNRNGGSRVPVGQWITTGAIHKILGVSKNVPAKWIRKWPEILKPVTPGSNFRGRIYIRRDYLLLFARQHPEQFGGIPIPNLLMLLENEPLAQSIAEAYPYRPDGIASYRRPPRPVRCVETGETFPSILAASRAVYVTKHAIWAALQRSAPSAGFHWEYASA
jgi:hypothetical protein